MEIEMRLNGKVAVVTGGGRGIGRAECLALAAAGASVVVNDFGGAADGSGAAVGPADEVADEISALGGKAIPHYGDVSQVKTGDELVQLALENFGQLDILINNAGILRDRMLHNMSDAEWSSVIDIHLSGTFYTTRAAARIFRTQRSGVVVNTGSESGLGSMGQANYAAAKEGIVGFTRTIARDLGRYGCRANVIRPRAASRLTLSDQLKDAIARAKKSGERAPDIARIENWVPEGVATFVTWLCTDAAQEVNGQDFVVSAEHISLMTQPQPTATVFTEEPWTLDRLDDLLPQSVTRGLSNGFPAKASG
jgi:NAD(P)-dependent dehydrogenase (short-subunit alcohol dehydrogenase family)